MKNKLLFFVIICITLFESCTIRLPAITFTQSGTAAEKQMIGNDKEIEKDGWILSSVKTSGLGSEIWKRENLNSEIYLPENDEEVIIHLKRIAYLAPEIKSFKNKAFIGEALDGKLKVNPTLNLTKNYNEYGDLKLRVEEILKLNNESRTFLYNKKSERIDKEFKDPKKANSEKTKISFTFYNLVEDGEYYEVSKNKWIKKE
jgi:hypothetical protein